MSQLLDITLGIMTALGGFVDIGELVFALAVPLMILTHNGQG